MKRLLPLFAVLAATGASPCPAADVVVAMGQSLPPYIMPDEWRGIEFDIIRRALELEGHTLTGRWVPFARVSRDLETGKVDAAAPLVETSDIKAFYSRRSHISYRNCAITLASRNLSIDRPEDLADKSVLAFQNARTIMGPKFEAAIADNPRYREEANQVLQPTLLFLGRVDAVVADRQIFAWFAGRPDVKAKVDTTQMVRFHCPFPPTEQHVAFRDQAIRDAFDRGLQRLRDSGEYARITASYSGYLHEEKTETQPGLSR
jgi:polar amino acid transport system substrate-binding protein